MASANGKCVACLNYSATTADQTTASDPNSTDWNDSCFYSTLRAIYGITAFINWLQSDHEHRNVCNLQTCMNCTMADLSHIIDPKKNEGQLVRDALQEIQRDYSPHSNDCYHFLDCLLKSMERSFAKRLGLAKYFEKIQQSARQLFCGSICLSVKCLSCQNDNISDNDFRVLDMSLTEYPTISDNINDAISRHSSFARERIVKCKSCGSKDLQAKGKLSFERQPDVLCIRGRADGDINIQTQFSQEIDLSGFCLDDNTDIALQYRLVSMVIQSELGQYTTILYSGEGSYRECFQFEDRPITNDCMLDVRTFVVFYELKCPPTSTNDDSFNDSYDEFFDDPFDDSIYIKTKPNVVRNDVNMDDNICDTDDDDHTEDIKMTEINAQSTILGAMESRTSYAEDPQSNVGENNLNNDCTEDIQISETNAASAIETENVAENDSSTDCTEDVQMSERNAESTRMNLNGINAPSTVRCAIEDSHSNVGENDSSTDCTEDVQMSERNAESTQMNLNGINAPSTVRRVIGSDNSSEVTTNGFVKRSKTQSTDQTYVRSRKRFVVNDNESSSTNRTVTTVYFRKMSNIGVALSADIEALRKHFEYFGTIKNLRAGRSKGSVTFNDAESAAKSIQAKNHKISKECRLLGYKIIVELKDNWDIESLDSTTIESENTQEETNATENEDETSGEIDSIVDSGLHSTTNDGENTQEETNATDDEESSEVGSIIESGLHSTTNDGENTQEETNATENEDETSGEVDSIVDSGLHSTTNDGENTQEETNATDDEESSEVGSIIDSGLHSTTNDGENTQEETNATENGDGDEDEGEDSGEVTNATEDEDEDSDETNQETMSVTEGNVYEKFSIDSTLDEAETTHKLKTFGHLIKELTIYALGERHYAIYKLVVEFCSESLKTLNLIEDEKVSDVDKGIRLILTNHFQNLESFDCDYDSDKMKKFIMQHRNLKRIILQKTEDFEHLIPIIAEYANELEELEIKVTDDLNMAKAKAALKRIYTLNYLKALTIYCPRKKNMAKFIEQLQPCRSLESLQLYNANGSPELVEKLSTLMNLQILRLRDCRHLKDLNPLAKLQQLTEITVTFSIFEIVNLDIVSFVKSLKKLKKLDIDIKVDQETKDILRTAQPRPLIYIL